MKYNSHGYSFSLEYLNKKRWKTADNRELLLKHINPTHYKNIIKLLNRKSYDDIINGLNVHQWLAIFNCFEQLKQSKKETRLKKLQYKLF